MPIVIKEATMRQFESILKTALKLPKLTQLESENLKNLKNSKKLADIPDLEIPDLDFSNGYGKNENIFSDINIPESIFLGE